MVGSVYVPCKKVQTKLWGDGWRCRSIGFDVTKAWVCNNDLCMSL